MPQSLCQIQLSICAFHEFFISTAGFSSSWLGNFKCETFVTKVTVGNRKKRVRNDSLEVCLVWHNFGSWVLLIINLISTFIIHNYQSLVTFGIYLLNLLHPQPTSVAASSSSGKLVPYCSAIVIIIIPVTVTYSYLLSCHTPRPLGGGFNCISNELQALESSWFGVVIKSVPLQSVADWHNTATATATATTTAI